MSTAPITQAAVAFAGALSAEQRQRAVLPLDSDERRKWLNAHPFVFRHGVMLEELTPDTRQLGLDLLRASLSARGAVGCCGQNANLPSADSIWHGQLPWSGSWKYLQIAGVLSAPC